MVIISDFIWLYIVMMISMVLNTLNQAMFGDRIKDNVRKKYVNLRWRYDNNYIGRLDYLKGYTKLQHEDPKSIKGTMDTFAMLFGIVFIYGIIRMFVFSLEDQTNLLIFTVSYFVVSILTLYFTSNEDNDIRNYYTIKLVALAVSVTYILVYLGSIFSSWLNFSFFVLTFILAYLTNKKLNIHKLLRGGRYV